jgi:hypothetical protein
MHQSAVKYYQASFRYQEGNRTIQIEVNSLWWHEFGPFLRWIPPPVPSLDTNIMRPRNGPKATIIQSTVVKSPPKANYTLGLRVKKCTVCITQKGRVVVEKMRSLGDKKL